MVRSAPGVSSIICRVISVVGVTVSAALAAPFTTTDCVAPASSSGICSTGFVPDATVSVSVASANPPAVTVSRYTPIGASGKFELSVGIGRSVQHKIRICGLQRHIRAGNRPVLRIVHHAVHGGKHRGECGKGSGQQAVPPQQQKKDVA